jgi:hypothetical protein
MVYEGVVAEERHVRLGIASIPPCRLDANRHRLTHRSSTVPSSHNDSGPQHCNLLSHTDAQQTNLVDEVLCATGRRTARLLPRLIYCATPPPTPTSTIRGLWGRLEGALLSEAHPLSVLHNLVAMAPLRHSEYAMMLAVGSESPTSRPLNMLQHLEALLYELCIDILKSRAVSKSAVPPANGQSLPQQWAAGHVSLASIRPLRGNAKSCYRVISGVAKDKEIIVICTN